jgi:hypothetical protein
LGSVNLNNQSLTITSSLLTILWSIHSSTIIPQLDDAQPAADRPRCWRSMLQERNSRAIFVVAVSKPPRSIASI